MRVYLLIANLGASLFVSSTFAKSAWPPPSVPASLVEYAPRPAYQPGEKGCGVFVLRIRIATGRVSQVIVGLTTGIPSADSLIIKTLLTWRFKPRALPHRTIRSIRVSPPQAKDETLMAVPIMP